MPVAFLEAGRGVASPSVAARRALCQRLPRSTSHLPHVSRQVEAERRDPVSRTAAALGFSRPSFYEAAAALESQGLAGLVPRRP